MKINGIEVELTVETSWEWCLRMWDDVDERLSFNRYYSVEIAKFEFCEEKGITDLSHDCFFCEYAGQGQFIDPVLCDSKCPGALAANYKYKENNKVLWCCQKGKNFADNPHEFNLYLKELNERRKNG